MHDDTLLIFMIMVAILLIGVATVYDHRRDQLYCLNDSMVLITTDTGRQCIPKICLQPVLDKDPAARF